MSIREYKCDHPDGCEARPRVMNYLLTDKDYCPLHVPRFVTFDLEKSRLNVLHELNYPFVPWEDPVV